MSQISLTMRIVYRSFKNMKPAALKRKFSGDGGENVAQNATVTLEIATDPVTTMSWPTLTSFHTWLAGADLQKYHEMYQAPVTLILTEVFPPEWNVLRLKDSLNAFNKFKTQNDPTFTPVTQAQLLKALLNHLPEKQLDDLTTAMFSEIYHKVCKGSDEWYDPIIDYPNKQAYEVALSNAAKEF